MQTNILLYNLLVFYKTAWWRSRVWPKHFGDYQYALKYILQKCICSLIYIITTAALSDNKNAYLINSDSWQTHINFRLTQHIILFHYTTLN